MVKLKPITEKSWLVLTDDGLQRIALLSEQKDKLVLIAKGAKTPFKNREEVNKFFNEDIFNNLIESAEEEEEVEYFINGHPVDFDHPFEVKADADIVNEHPEIPLYTKTEKSTVYYAAGYYCLGFPAGWMPAYCPKLSTINKYEYKGPFKSDKEMKSILTKLRRCTI